MHYFAIVLAPPDKDPMETVGRLMAPHQEDENGGWWDYYGVGHGWELGDGRTVAPVRECGEVRPFTLVAPDVVAHRMWVDRDADALVEDPDWDRTAATIMLAHRDYVAVALDYHC